MKTTDTLFAPILRSAAGKSRNVCGIASKEKRASFVSRAMCMLVLAHLLVANLISASCSSIAPAPTPMPLPSVGYLPNTTRTQRTINTSGDQYPRKKGKSRPIRSTNPSSFYYSALLALSLSDSERSFSRIYSSFHQSRKKPPISAVGAGAGGESRTISLERRAFENARLDVLDVDMQFLSIFLRLATC